MKKTVKKIITKHIIWTEWSAKGSEYYTCKECEDEVNRKGHLTNPQEADPVENVKKWMKSGMNIIPAGGHTGCSRKKLTLVWYKTERKNWNVFLTQWYLDGLMTFPLLKK